MLIVKLHVCTVEQCTEIEKLLFRRGLCQALGSGDIIDKESQWLFKTQEHSKCYPYLERFEVWLPVSVEDPSAWLVFAVFGVSDVSIGRTPSP